MTKIDSAELVAGQNMFRTLEDLNFVIVSDFEFRASNFRFRHLNTYDQFWRDFYKLLLGRDTS